MATRGTPLPQELRDRIARLFAAGHSWRSVMREVGVGTGTVRKYRVHRLTRRRPEDGLAEIVTAWPTLTEATRKAILRIVRA